MKCLLVGGGGPVGVSLLYIFKKLGWTVSVVDPKVPKHIAIHRENLRGTLLDWQDREYTLADVESRLKSGKFDLFLDLTPTLDKRKTIAICDELGISLVNSTMVDYWADIHIAAYNFIDDRPVATRKPHVVATGMNPGAVNAMAEEIIRKHGQPDNIIYWEYDGSLPHNGKLNRLATTWCQGESHAEVTLDWNFEVIEEGTLLVHEDALSWARESFADAGVPLDTLPIPEDAEAFLIGHEECVYMGWRHDTRCKFIYGFHPENMKLMEAHGYNPEMPDLLVNEPGKPILGRDIVGVSVLYEGEEDDDADTWYGLYCMLENNASTPPDTNVTCHLVACGMAASALALTDGNVKPGVHLTHEIDGWMRAFRQLVDVHEYTAIDDAFEDEEDEDETDSVAARQRR